MTRSTTAPVHSDGRASRSGQDQPVRRLDQAPSGRAFTVRLVHPEPGAPDRARQLEDIGFFPGERVMVLRRGFPGGDPIVVRIGHSTFALRASEAACVQLDDGAGTAPA